MSMWARARAGPAPEMYTHALMSRDVPIAHVEGSWVSGHASTHTGTQADCHEAQRTLCHVYQGQHLQHLRHRCEGSSLRGLVGPGIPCSMGGVSQGKQELLRENLNINLAVVPWAGRPVLQRLCTWGDQPPLLIWTPSVCCDHFSFSSDLRASSGSEPSRKTETENLAVLCTPQHARGATWKVVCV